ncbi:hypothetical protein JAAARDRAFT_252760 [Jaapia argillacea MUCL 33604]|uniref:Uncharacterized protein n=1 Tax=Jaapia argillacea MUCL 33604 TaxID=933084 RepID=A0A067PT20_9AGAM|nr:hypothetical protein JAAARDRAFT_252760 [Jaapia argillacea MUCL 33604]
MFNTSSITGVHLEASGLVALADLRTIAYRTALTGSASIFDILFLAPGIHCQQAASEVNGGEYPAAGALTNGYVFRIENPATVSYLQKIGESGHLVNVTVLPPAKSRCGLPLRDLLATSLYLSGIALTIMVVASLVSIRDWWALGVVGMLAVARLLNVVVIKRRSTVGWKGAKEPGVYGDLLVLLSQDRWIRMRGSVDDLKTVTAGQWLREQTSVESFCVSFATLLVYSSAALAGNASTIGSLLIAGLLLISVAFLGLCNSMTKKLKMFGLSVYPEGERKSYERRLEMVGELVAISGRDDWAIGMGLYKRSNEDKAVQTPQSKVDS